MKILPFVDIPFVKELRPTAGQRRATIKDLSREYWEICNLMYENDGDAIEDYFFQIGFIVEGEVRTSESVIHEIMLQVVPYNGWEEYNKSLPDIRNHLTLYCEKAGIIPEWGYQKYYDLTNGGIKTPRILQGPHKDGGLGKRESRMVVLDEIGEFVYGPTLSYLKQIKKVERYQIGEK